MTQATRAENGRGSWPKLAVGLAKGTFLSFYEHWALAGFSLVAAFAIWFVIQDVENPRVRAFFPPEGELASIEVEAINADRLIPNTTTFVRIEVEGREDDLALLSTDDFQATIDVKGIPANSPTAVPVQVTSSEDGVKVLSVTPAQVIVTLEPVEEREFDVRLNPTGQLPSGLSIDDQEIEPLTVTVAGLGERIANVASVDLDVNLAALNEGTNVLEGELRARNASGGLVDVAISPARGKVTYTVTQSFVQRSLSVLASVAGQVAPGYRTGTIVIEPAVISASGPADRMPAELRTEPIQLGNARSEIRLVANIAAPDNLALERRQVSVRIEVKPIECSGAAGAPCGPLTLPVAPAFDNPPAALAVEGPVRVYVQLSGPLPVLDTVNQGQITARINLAGATAGTSAYSVTVTVPPNLASQGVRAEPVPPITLTLGPG
jgi:YbbR domain-containing protein